eukprot:498409-Rhodomonas_salina.1
MPERRWPPTRELSQLWRWQLAAGVWELLASQHIACGGREVGVEVERRRTAARTTRVDVRARECMEERGGERGDYAAVRCARIASSVIPSMTWTE